jgi:hypothetical protein
MKGFGKKPTAGKPNTTAGTRKTPSQFKMSKPGSKLGKKSSLNNILSFGSLFGGKSGQKGSTMAEDAEIMRLQGLLGLKRNKDLNSLMGEFADDGLDDFLDLIFDESAKDLENDGDKLTRPEIKMDEIGQGGVSLEEFMGLDGDGDGDDGDDDEEKSVSLGGLKGGKAVASSTSTNNTLGKPLTKDANPAQKGKMRTLLDENSSDDDNIDIAMNNDDDDDDDDNEDEPLKTSQKKLSKNDKKTFQKNNDEAFLQKLMSPPPPTTTTTTKPSQHMANLPVLKMSDKYVPPFLRRRLGISFDRSAMKASFAKYLSQNESFVDTQNDANQNSYKYHGIMTDVSQHKDLYLSIQSKLNKLSHLNIAGLFSEIVEELILEQQNPVGLLVDLSIFATQEFCTQQTSILTSTVQALGIICAGLHKVLGIQYGSIMIESFVTFLELKVKFLFSEYVKSYSKNFSLSKHGVIYLSPIDVKPILNIIDVIGVMYSMSCVPHKFILGLCDWIMTADGLFSVQVDGDGDNNGENVSVDVEKDKLTKLTKLPKLNSKKDISKKHTQNNDNNNHNHNHNNNSQIDPQKLNQDIKWIIQCTILSHILTNFGLQLRKDDQIISRLLFQTIITQSQGYESNWTTQQLLAIVQDVKNNKQYQGLGDDKLANNSQKSSNLHKNQKSQSDSAVSNIDYVGLREQLFTAMNFILDTYSEDLFEKHAEKKGRRETKKQQIQKQLQLLRDGQSNKKTISTKHLSRNLLNITFQDVLRVQETGRWWIVGAGFKQTQNIMDTGELTLEKNQNGHKNLLCDSDDDDNDSDSNRSKNSDNDDNDDDDDDDNDNDILLQQINPKILLNMSNLLGLITPLEKFVFSTIVSSTDHIHAYTAITSKHSNHLNSSGRNQHGGMINISPSMYGEVIKVIFKTVMDWDQICQMESNLFGKNTNAQSDWYNSIFSDLLSKLLVNYPQYRFPCCTVIWDMIQQCQVQFNDTSVQLNNAKMAQNKAKMMQKRGTKVNLSQYETKVVNFTQDLAKINTKTSHLAKVIGDLITQPLTLDFYVLRKMAFTPMMYVMMMDEKEQEINENEHGDNGENGGNGEKHSLFKIFDNILIKKDDINSMNDNTIVFFHTFCEQICKKLANLSDNEIEERLKDMVAPLQGQNITNYLTMDKDLLRLRYTKFSKYEQVRQKAKIAKKNFDGMRILSCLSETMKQIALPMITMSVIDAQDNNNNNNGLDVVKRVQMVAEMFFKVLNTDNVVRK